MRQASEREKQIDEQEKADGQWFRSVGLRTITAIVAIPIVLAVVWLGGWWAFGLAFVVVVWGIYELYTMMLHEGHRPLILMSVALSLTFLIAAMLPQWQLWLIELGISLFLIASFFWLFLRQKREGAIVDWALTLAITIYLGWPMSFFLSLRGFEVGWSNGLWWMLAVFGGVWGFDTGAFFAGHFFGRHKLAPEISPGKTWEGTFGGLLFSIAAALLFVALPIGVPWYLALLLGGLVGVAATLGDLAESLIKRQMKVKDSGQFMPGHGGILDRIDSLLFSVLVVFLFSQFIGKL